MPRVLNSNDPFARRAEEFADRYGGARFTDDGREAFWDRRTI
jgi:hypothetical protein